jgi:Carboxypeptidase regulatory-like domain
MRSVCLRIAGVLLFAATVAASAANQQQAATVSGTVLDEQGRPVSRAAVTVRLPGMNPKPLGQTTADDRGRFIIAGLPAGEFVISASKPGYVDAREYDPTAAPNVALSSGSRATLTLRLQAGGAITGTVFDRDGTPARGINVEIEARLNQLGRIVWAPRLSTRTNSRGEYRLSGLAGGSYIVAAQHPPLLDGPFATADGQAESYVTLFHPDSPTAKAAMPITVAAGETRTGVDFRLRTVPVSRIEVNLATVDGLEIDRASGGCRPITADGDTGTLGFGNVEIEGGRARLVCAAVRPGPHMILVIGTTRAPERDPSRVWGAIEAVSTGQPLELSLTLYPGERVVANTTFDDAAGSPDLSALLLELETVESRFQPLTRRELRSTVSADDRQLLFEGVPPGRYRVALERGPGWGLSGATLDGRDVLDLPFDVGPGWASDLRLTLSRVLTKISGRVLNAAASPQAGETVVVFATDDRYWLPGSRRLQTLKTDRAGRFEFQGIPPGHYWIVADPGGVFDESWDSATLLQLSRSARRIELGPGQTLVQDLTAR